MVKQIWINLPVKNVAKSVQFFSKLGFKFSMQHANNIDSACMLIGEKNVVIMLFPVVMFEQFTQQKTNDTTQNSQMLISIDAESQTEVDELAQKAEKAGGTIFGKPTQVQGWMYGCGFCDLDGHRWNVLYMDMSKLPKQK